MTVRICACGCGASLAGLRSDAVWASEACKKRAERERSRDKAGTGHPLQTARAEQEASELNDHLGQIVYNAIVDCLKSKGSVHADDLEPYFPEEHRDRCRKLIGGQFGSLAGRKYIEGIEYLRSAVPSRKGAKSWAYVFTAKGRAKLVGTGGGKAPELPAGSASSGHSPRSGEPAPSPSEKASGATYPPVLDASPEPLTLLPDPPAMFDPDQRAA